MKSIKLAKIFIMTFLSLALMIIPANQLKVQAAETTTVYGTVQSGTTADMLLLSTSDGTMKIKLDKDTDSSGYKILLPDKKIYVSVYHGSDKYLHAAKITSDAPASAATVNTSNTFTVTGTIDKKTTDTMLYFNTEGGTMQIKLDSATDMSNCSLLVMDKTYDIVCARGSDAYMHAVSISDYKATSSTAGNNVATTSITGTVSDKTKESLLYLSTDGGVMQFKIDSDADTSSGMVLTPDRKLTVSFYHGNDAYLHAVKIVGVKNNSSDVKLDSSTMVIDGTVENKSNEDILYLNTVQGTMQLKLDQINSINNAKVLVKDKKITVTYARGSDAYLHATKISSY